jgi:hypothetical protein
MFFVALARYLLASPISLHSRKELSSRREQLDMTNIQSLSTKMTQPHGVLGTIQHDLIDSNRRSQGRMTEPELFAASGPEEVLVVEERANLRPAQVVESKLTRLLQEAAFPASHLQVRGLLKTR